MTRANGTAPRLRAALLGVAMIVASWPPTVLVARATLPQDVAGPPSADGVEPIVVDTRSSNDDCGELGFDHGIAAAGDGTVSGGELTVTVSGYDSPTGFVNWSSTLPIHGVYVKGGPSGGDLFSYRAGDIGDRDLHTPQKADGGYYDVSHVAFCWNDAAPEPDVVVVKANEPSAAVAAGDEITYVLTVSNAGDGTATGVAVADQLPSGASFVSATAGCSESAGVVTCALGDIGPGASLDVRIVASVDDAFCGVLVNDAHVTSASEDGASTANNASNEVANTVACDQPTPPDVSVEKTSDAEGLLGGGDEIVYAITVRNVGDETANGVEIHDVLPPGVEVRIPPLPSFQGEFCTVASSVVLPHVPVTTVDCGPAPLAPGSAASIEVRVQVTGDRCGPITNRVDVEAADEPASNVGADNHAEATDEVECEPRIELVKGGPALAHVGDTVVYAFLATNVGGVDLSNVGLVDAGCTAPPALQDDGDGDGVLSPGESWSYRCERTILAADGDRVHNVATVGGEHEGRSVSASDDHDVDVIHPDVALVKTASPTSVPPGSAVEYTYRVTNTGDTRLFDVSVDDDVVGHVATIAVVAPGQSVEVTHPFTLGSSPVTNVGTAAGEDLLGSSVSATDTATVTVVAAAGDGPGGTPFTGWSDLRAWVAGIAALTLWGLVMLVAGARRVGVAGGRHGTRSPLGRRPRG